MEVDLQVLGVDDNVEISVASRGLHKRVIAVHLTRGCADGFIGMTAASGDDVRYLRLLSRNRDIARVALVGVGMARDQRIGTDSGRLTGVVDLLEHCLAATVTTLAERRMMDANDQSL